MNARLTPAAATNPELDAFWMPFTANRQFKANPRLLARAKGMYYTTSDGREVLDGVAGLWCVNAGHGRREITEAVTQQLETMEFAPTFQMGHPIAFELANRLAKIAPPGLDRIFFTNSGSESVDTALKIAIAYHRARGAGQRTRLIGREKGYHGVGFGGMSVGGMVNNRKFFGSSMLPGVDHLPHTLDIEHNAFSRGIPQWGMHLANELERLIALHDASTIAAVIVEPISGSAGVVLPPAGYLKRLREICDKHDILLIFDEVITGFGRVGKALRRAGIRGDARLDHHRERIDEWRGAHGRGLFSAQDLRRLHAGSREFDRAVSWLYLLSAPRRMRRGPGDPGHLCERRPADAGGGIERTVGKRGALPARPAACHRHTQLRLDRRRGIGAAPGKTRGTRL